MNNFWKDFLGTLIRHGLTIFGGGAIVAGSSGGTNAEIAAGAVATLVGVGLSTLKNKKK